MLRYLRLLLYTLTIIISLSCPSCIQNRPINYSITQKIIIPTIVDGPLSFPTDFYITTTFNEEQFSIIEQSIEYWENITTNIVQTNLVQNWEPPQEFDHNFYRYYPYKTAWLLKRDSDAIQNMFETHGGFRGISYGNYIIIVDDPGTDTITNLQLFIVFSHEFGHQLGMQHIKKKYGALMNSSCHDGKATKWDLIQFCHLYDCSERVIPLLQTPDINP
jgi:hypothetical protein